MCLVGKAHDRRNFNQRYPGADDLAQSTARPNLGAEPRGGRSVDPRESTGQGFGNNAVRIGPMLEAAAWIAYDLVCQQIRPIVNDRRNLPQLRCQNIKGGLRIAFSGSSDGIRVRHAPCSKAILGTRERKIQDRRASSLEAIEMRIKCVVQQYVTGADAKPTPGSAFLIPPGKDNRSIGTRMSMPGLQRPAVALFATRGDRSEKGHLGSEAQWNGKP
jgi:hypothetical protein